jgi:diaminobutyrate-2-oxoglutarate transaminase
MATQAKIDFLESFRDTVLEPRNLKYKVQFPGPTGADAVEAAIKIARRVTGRCNIVSFSNSYHGVTFGALAVTASPRHRAAAGFPLLGATSLPYDGYLGAEIDTAKYLELVLSHPGSGIDLPAAVIVETVQGEGGVNIASYDWLRKLESVCHEHGVLLIIDDIQVGCGRTGKFFSFEEANVSPDIIILSKSLSGFGLPLSIVLIKPQMDCWKPGEHGGTFRGNNLALVTARAALMAYWRDDDLTHEVNRKGALINRRLRTDIHQQGERQVAVRGRGMICGLECQSGDIAERMARRAFEKGLIIETCGAHGQVIKCLPPLTIPDEELDHGLKILLDSVNEILECV